MTRLQHYVGLDVGGTTIKAGVVNNSGHLLNQVSLPTEAFRGQEDGLATMARCIRQAVADAGRSMDQITGIGVAAPGSLDIPTGIILNPPNLKPWRNVPVKQFIEDEFGKPTAFQNDANAAAYGEYWVGKGRGASSLVLFTLGTGIGGGIILDGRILNGAHSHAGELGQTKIEASWGRLCGCGQRGCLEAYASATAVVKRTKEELEYSTEPSLLRDLVQRGWDLTCKDVFDAAAADELAKVIVDQTAYYLGIACSNMMHTINPDMICFAGGMTGAGPEFLESIRGHARRLSFEQPAERTAIEYAVLGSTAGIIGAAGCARMLIS